MPRRDEGTVVYRSGFTGLAPEGLPAGWEAWAPRGEIAPRWSVDDSVSRAGEGYSLRADSNGLAGCYGMLNYTGKNTQPGAWYRLRGYYRADGLTDEKLRVYARTYWLDARGQWCWKRTLDYFPAVAEEGEWRRVEGVCQAPDNAVAVRVQLVFAWSATGTVWWDHI